MSLDPAFSNPCLSFEYSQYQTYESTQNQAHDPLPRPRTTLSTPNGRPFTVTDSPKFGFIQMIKELFTSTTRK